MSLTSPIKPYDPTWPQQYAAEEARLRPVFGSELTGIHHVGSTAVPELAAKAEIDVLAVVASDGRLDDWGRSLATLGYRRGGDLSSGHHFFKRDFGGVRTHKLHVCLQGHGQIARMLKFRDHLRQHAEDRFRYQELKLRPERDNSSGIRQYLIGKDPFIRDILARLDGASSVKRCMECSIRPAIDDDAAAISAVILRALRETNAKDYTAEIVARIESSFDPDSVRRLIGQRIVFVATIGSRLVGTAGLDGSVVRTVFVSPDAQGRGIGKLLMTEIERTAREGNIPSFTVSSSVTAVAFYARLGFKVVRDSYFGDERTIIMERVLIDRS